MPRTQDIQDLIEHVVATEGTHHISKKPAPGGVPVAYVDGTIDNNWLSDRIFKKGDKRDTILASDLPDNVIWLVNGKIPAKHLPSTIKADAFQSGGTTSASNYLLADGTDIMTLVNAVTDGYGSFIITNRTGTGSNFERPYEPITDVNLRINSGTLTLTEKKGFGNCNCCDSC
jgi:hypothetical protein